jgi:predicted NACHT family NTPase
LEYCQSACELFRLNAAELQDRLQAGKAAFYLDGLDEIFDPSARQSVVEEIVVLSTNYPRAPVVVTTRKVGYEPERLGNADFSHATIEEFDIPQMLDFLRQWHRMVETDDEERTLMQARLERALDESPAIRELAGNPLLLTMMAILNRNQELPRNRVALYREASRVLLDDWDARKALLPVGEFDREDKESLLREIAGDMQQAKGGLAGNLIEQARLKKLVQSFLEALPVQDSHEKARLLVKQLTERNFVLAFAGANRFSFVHRTFLEYYCASWFVERLSFRAGSPMYLSFEQLQDKVFGQHWKDEKWHEVLRLIAGMLHETKAEELICFLMSLNGQSEKLINLLLAAGCLNEVRNRRAIQTTSQTLWHRITAEAIRFDDRRFLGTDEAGHTKRAAVRCIALAWKGENARAWLSSAVSRNMDATVREAAVRELARGWRHDSATLSLLLDRTDSSKEDDPAVRLAALQELARGWKDNSATLPSLWDRANNDSEPTVRLAAMREIARCWKNDSRILPLLQRLIRSDCDDIRVRQAALQELARGWRDDPDTNFLLDRALNDEDERMRKTAAQELERGGHNDPRVTRILQRS